jgi:cellulose synthase/poly-beta-1,6-N-acetylglucosamine synthase-like glycosyltransferase
MPNGVKRFLKNPRLTLYVLTYSMFVIGIYLLTGHGYISTTTNWLLSILVSGLFVWIYINSFKALIKALIYSTIAAIIITSIMSLIEESRDPQGFLVLIAIPLALILMSLMAVITTAVNLVIGIFIVAIKKNQFANVRTQEEVPSKKIGTQEIDKSTK